MHKEACTMEKCEMYFNTFPLESSLAERYGSTRQATEEFTRAEVAVRSRGCSGAALLAQI